MKRTLVPATLAALEVTAGWLPASHAQDKTLKTKEDRVSYSMGLVFGQRIQGELPDLKMESFMKGLQDGYDKNAKPLMSKDEVRKTLTEFQQAERKKQVEKFKKMAKENKKKSDAFLAANAKKPGVKTTKSGLQYEVVKAGNGPKPKLGDEVTVHYTGKLIDGKVFDSSRKRGKPVTFELGDVIPGWKEGLQLMHEGARYKLFIPPKLAYGEGGNRTIGPNEALIFDVELLKVKHKQDGKNGSGKSD